jgi:outer membrane receptor protein involved in Fe transport
VRHEWGWGELTSTTGYVRHAYGSFYDSTDTQTQYTDLAETSVYSERARTHMLVQDIFVNSRGAGRFEWLAGLYGEHTIEHAPNQFLAHNSFAPNVVVYGDDRHDRISELAAYAEGSYEFAPGWRAAVGGRLFTIRTHTHSDVVSEKFAPRTVDRDRHFTSFSPKVSLQKEFAGGDLAYLVMSEGYRAGGVNSGGALPLAAVFETYAPDRLRNYELGLKLQAFGRRLQINSAAFYDVWKDLQTDQFRPSGIPFTTNVGDAHISGLESELAVRVLDGLTVQLNGRISRTHITNANPAFAASLLTPLVANGLPGAPAVSGGGVVTYERDLFDAWRLRLAGEASYVGRSYVTFDASLPKMGGYVRSKLSAELSAGRFGVQAFVTNALNDYSDTFGFGNPFFPLTARQITPQRPRTVGVTLFAAY